ncbi:hypothetical protein CRG98_038197 [Punica granatum]|uniref:CCHC-type domain-containing protein n=1 Tax=Punica granatum TaxID=22663 RepID=A0A2I0IBQ6_PUNGR|nr:hypothetical protein CRG98_038197 [Punica granatum]
MGSRRHGEGMSSLGWACLWASFVSNYLRFMQKDRTRVGAFFGPRNIYIDQQTLTGQRKKVKVYQLLLGLNPEFRTARSNILSRDPLPTLNQAFAMMSHVEQQRLVARGFEAGSQSVPACMAQGAGGQYGSPAGLRYPPGGRPTCDYCGKEGHVKPHCYQLVGYPTHWEHNREQQKKGKGKKGGYL